jgi:hypothetical protein
MKNVKNFMSDRNVGLLGALSVITVIGFTATLLLISSNPNPSQVNDFGKSDTHTIDASRTIANTSPRQLQPDTVPGSSIFAPVTSPGEDQLTIRDRTRTVAPAATAIPSQSTQQTDPLPEQPVTDQPTVTGSTPTSQNPVMAIVDGVLGQITPH